MLKEVTLKKNKSGEYYIMYKGDNFCGNTDGMDFVKSTWICDRVNDLLNAKFKTINFNIATTGGIKTVKGYRFADTDFVVHKSLPYDDIWILAHYPSGMALDRQYYHRRLDALDNIIDVLEKLYDALIDGKLKQYDIINK